MVRERPGLNLPGNDGRWYLELVGAVEPEPDIDTYATLEQLVALPLGEDTATMSAAAAAAAVGGALAGDRVPDGEFIPLLPGSVITTVGERTTMGSRWRWLGLGLVVLLVAGAVGVGVYALPRAAESEAALAAAEHRDALTELRNELLATQAALAHLTDPAAADADVLAVSVAVADLSAASGEAIAVATAPLPATLPLVPRSSFNALEPNRAAMTMLGANGRDLAGRLGVGFIYRTAVEGLFAVGPVPTSVAEVDIPALSLALAADLAETGRLVADLPQDAAFGGVREAAVTASERYATWQLEYLDAVRSDDPERVTALVGEFDATVDGLAAVLDEALLALRTELDRIIVDLAAELDRAIAAVPN